MTISYTLQKVSSSDFASFSRLLVRWHGSIWKSVYKELVAWLLIYALFSAVYRMVLNESQRVVFEDLVSYCHKISGVFPLTLMLGFFVTVVVQRWWQMFEYFGYIENTALYVATYINGNDERTRMIRRNIVRYTVLNEAMVFRDVSPVVGRRFPDDEAFKTAGLLTENELIALNSVSSPHGKYWLPIYWAFNLIKQARLSGHIESNRACEVLNEFIFNLGWMKVAEALLNPFGDDDDDFELNWFIDRNLQIGLSIVDDAIGKEPPLERDFFWDDVTPEPLYLFGSRNVPLHYQNQTEAEKAARLIWTAAKTLLCRSRNRADHQEKECNDTKQKKRDPPPLMKTEDYLQSATVLLDQPSSSISTLR